MAENMQDGKFVHNNTESARPGSVMPLFSLKGKTAIVSGAAAGIGFAVAETFAEAGANVAIWYNSNEIAVQRAAEIEQAYGVKCKAYPVNVISYEAVQTAIDQIISEFNGRLDIFVANSGIPWTEGPSLDGKIETFSKVMATNVDGVFNCARVAGLHWRRQKREGTTIDGRKLEGFTTGSFIATASISAHIVNIPQLQAPYNASKAAVKHMVKSLGVEWVGFARANTVSPGYIKTEISTFCSPDVKRVWHDRIPMGREGETVELKGAYLYLASDASTYTTAADIVVDGGYCAL
ncbi:sorbitol utilization protein SOU2 [Cercophora newfieldiana]|uniref:Sorbitol utilization protein SOU2 n=1 Tax=Cercophora newfieldiana TaxID=92897 RepID=A0AA39YFQ7_9PEZI|nr:sorbitol utilization protein SOU2 [Cercophora newfieldiana]